MDKRAILNKYLPFPAQHNTTSATDPSNLTLARTALEGIESLSLRARLRGIEQKLDLLSDMHARPYSLAQKRPVLKVLSRKLPILSVNGIARKGRPFTLPGKVREKSRPTKFRFRPKSTCDKPRKPSKPAFLLRPLSKLKPRPFLTHRPARPSQAQPYLARSFPRRPKLWLRLTRG